MFDMDYLNVFWPLRIVCLWLTLEIEKSLKCTWFYAVLLLLKVHLQYLQKTEWFRSIFQFSIRLKKFAVQGNPQEIELDGYVSNFLSDIIFNFIDLKKTNCLQKHLKNSLQSTWYFISEQCSFPSNNCSHIPPGWNYQEYWFWKVQRLIMDYLQTTTHKMKDMLPQFSELLLTYLQQCILFVLSILICQSWQGACKIQISKWCLRTNKRIEKSWVKI